MSKNREISQLADVDIAAQLDLDTKAEIDDNQTTVSSTWSSNRVNTELSTKQDTLVSGTNIKTFNGESLLGSGNISVNATDTNVISVSVNTTMVKSTHYIVTADSITMTLPSTPTVGDKVIVSVGDFYNTTVARNGNKIAFLDEDLKIDTADITVSLQYINSNEGWRIV